MLLYEQENRTNVRMFTCERWEKMNKVKKFIDEMENGAEITLECNESFKLLFGCQKDEFLFTDEGFYITAGSGENSRTMGIDFKNITVLIEDDTLKMTDNNGNRLLIERF